MNPPSHLPAVLLLAALLLPSPPARAQEVPPPKREEADREAAAAADRKALEELAARAIPVVEKARGLPFQEEVPAAPITAEQFVDKYFRSLAEALGGEARVESASRLLVRLGVLEPGTALRRVLGDFLKGNVSANYDPRTKRVSFLPGASRSLPLMVHELTHALDDQHFDMQARIAEWDGSFDRALAYGALAEGDAESVEYRFMTGGGIANQTLEQLRATANLMADNILRGRFGDTPPALVLAFRSQYLEGLLFAEALRRGPKGEEGVNDAFRRPPLSTEQVLHPRKYAAGEGFTALTLAAPEGAGVTHATTLGEIGLRTVLVARGVPRAEAEAAAAGWDGDTAALVGFEGGVEAFVWVTAWDSDEEAAAFKEALVRAFPPETGQESAKLSRLIVHRRSTKERPSTVELAEAPLDQLAAVVETARDAAAARVPAPAREGVLADE